jgi:hypothetical protein
MRLLKTTQRRWHSHFLATSLALLFGAEAAQAEPRIDDLKRCLQDFDGIEWKLPYRPPLRIRSCATPTVNYDTGDKTSAGRRILELIGELTLGDETDQLSSDERYAALQLALHTHFDALFKQRGYRLVVTEQGDARTKYNAYAHCMVIGHGNCAEDKPEPPKPPIPYVSLARYVRQAGAQTITLTYKAEAKNTWTISLDGVPATAGAR